MSVPRTPAESNQPPATSDPTVAENQRRLAEARNRWKDPAWRSARLNESIIHLEARYGRLFEKFTDWPPQKIEMLKRRLAENELSQMEIAQPRSYPVTDSDAKALNDALWAKVAENKQQLREFLGERDYLLLEEAEKAEPYRETVGSIVSTMRSRNVHLDGALEEPILTAYSSAIQEAANQASTADYAAMNTTQRAALKEKQTQQFLAILSAKMQPFLNEDQLKVFLEAEIEQAEISRIQ